MYQNPQTQAGRATSPSQVQQSYTIQHDFNGTASITATLTHAFSDISGVNVTDAELALKDHVNPEALNRLFTPTANGSPRANGQLTFNIQGYQTTVYSTGLISIVPPQEYRPQPRL